MADEPLETAALDPQPATDAVAPTPIAEPHPNDPWKEFKAAPKQQPPATAGDPWAAFKPKLKNNESLPVEPMNALERGAAGAIDPLHGLRQLYNHVVGSPADAAAADKGIQEREADLQKRGAGEGDLARSVGRMVPAVAAGAIAGPLTGGIAGAMIGGTAAELANPVASGNYAEEKTKQALMGAAFGGGGGLIMKGGAAVVGPTVREAAAELMKNGVQLTPGQIAGGILRRGEEAAKSIPVLGSFIRGAEGRSIDGFNKAVINQSLDPIGVQLPKNISSGHEAITFAKDKLGDAYDSLLPKMQLTMDAPLASDLSNVRYLASSALPEAQYKQLENIMQQRVQRYFNNTGSIPGNELKAIERDLNSLASSYRSSTDGAQRELAHSLDDIRGSVRDALTRQNPQNAAELQKINDAYAMFTRVESAAARRAGGQGVFTPSDLLQSIKSADKTVRKGAFARGDALMQDFAEFADTVLPSKLPDSGTTERGIWDAMILHGAAPTVAGGAIFAPKAAAIVGGGVLPYTKIGGKSINAAAQPGPGRMAAGNAMRAATPATGSALEPLLSAGSMDYLVDRAQPR